MEWDDLRIFLAVARGGTLGAAARALGSSHPTVGRRLQALEDALGTKLVQRSGGSLMLTAEGAAILPLAEQAEDATLGIARRLAGQDGALQGSLRVAASDWFGAWMLPPVVASFSAAHGLVRVELMTAARVYSLGHREADLAFRVVPFEEADIVQRRIGAIRFGVYASAAQPAAPGGGAGLTLIEDAPTRTYPDVGWLRERLPEARVVLSSNNRTVQALMCARGVGVAVLPRIVGDQLPGLRRVDLGEEPPPRDMWMGFHRDLRTLQRLRAFIDFTMREIVW